MICIQMGSILIKLLPRLLKIITFKTYCIIHSLGLFRYMYVHCVAVVANLKNIHNIHVNEPLEGAHANSDGQKPGGHAPPPQKRDNGRFIHECHLYPMFSCIARGDSINQKACTEK